MSSASSSAMSSSSAGNVTSEPNNVYDVRDTGSATASSLPNLYHALRTPISQFTVEFLHVNEVKPHIVFKFNYLMPFNDAFFQGGPFRAVRLSMELGEGRDEIGAGACRIKLCRYTTRTDRATAAFQFELRGTLTLEQVLTIIRGEWLMLPDALRGDLTKFRFTSVGPNYDGCRDWIAQAFLRLHAVGWVSWHILGIIGPADEAMTGNQFSERLMPSPVTPHITWHNAGFHDIIGKAFALPQIMGWSNSGVAIKVVVYSQLPLECGTFLSPEVVRFYQLYGNPRLPYHAQP